jgi:DNA repair protein RecO (recombination protein O)
LRRKATPNGDVVLWLLTPEGKLRGVARAGAKNGLAAKVNLFHHLTVQVYQRPGNDMAMLSEIILEGALENLTQPEVYPYAHWLAELADKLYAEDDHVGQAGFELVSGALRGLARHEDPNRVALVMAWKLLGAHGLYPRVSSCPDTGETECLRFDVQRGSISANSGLQIGEEAIWELRRIHAETVREIMLEPLPDNTRNALWRVLEPYIATHVGSMQAWAAMKVQFENKKLETVGN